MKKTLLVVLLALALACSFGVVAFAADSYTADKVDVLAGETVTITVPITDATAGNTYALTDGNNTLDSEDVTEGAKDVKLSVSWKADEEIPAYYVESHATADGSNSSRVPVDMSQVKVYKAEATFTVKEGTTEVKADGGVYYVSSGAKNVTISDTPGADCSVEYSSNVNNGVVTLSSTGTTKVTATVTNKALKDALGGSGKSSVEYEFVIKDTANTAKLTKLGSFTPNSRNEIKGTVDVTKHDNTTLTAVFEGKSLSYADAHYCTVSIDGDKVKVDDLRAGKDATFTLIVTAIDGTTTKKYKVTLTPEAGYDFSVKIEGKEGGTYLKASQFKPTTYTYDDFDIDEDEDKITVTIAWDESKYDYDFTVKYNGKTVKMHDDNGSGADYEEEYIFNVDPDDLANITIKVEKKTYTFKLGSGSSGDCVLDSLKVYEKSSGSSAYDLYPRFDEDITDYYIFLPYDKSDADLYVLADCDKDWEIRKTLSSSSDERDKRFKIGSVGAGDKEKFTFYCVNPDDETEYTEYTITAIMAGKSDNDDTDTLKSLELFSGETSSKAKEEVDLDFKSSTTKYTVAVPADHKYLKISWTLDDRDSYVLVNGDMQSSSTSTKSKTVTLDKGKNTIEIVVVAENCKDIKTYTLTVNRGGSIGLINNIYVTGLANSLSPVFSTTQQNYVGYVNASTSSIQVTGMGASSSDTVYVSCTKGGSGYAAGSNGSATATITLANGLNVISVWSSGDSSTAIRYYISVYKPVANPTVKLSSQKVTVNGQSKGTISAYNINGNNFLQLRDVAVLLNGTSKQFNVSYNSSTGIASITTNTGYVPNGTENAAKANFKNNGITTQIFTLDGQNVYPIAYNISGSNFVSLRDMGALMNFGITFTSSNNTININTTNSYTPGL